MSNKDVNMSIVVEAKTQYTKQLVNILKDIVYRVLKHEFTNAVKTSDDPNRILFNFQTNLKSIRVWNSDMIKRETDKLLEKCSYLNEIITAVFISNIRILTSIKIDKTKKKLKITIPSNETFVHKVFVTSAKYIFENPFLFRNHKNNEDTSEIYKWIIIAIEETIFELLPIKELLDSYLNEDRNDQEEEGGEEEEEEKLSEDTVDDDKPVDNENGILDSEVLNDFDDDTADVQNQPSIDMNNNKVEPNNSFFSHPSNEDDEIKTVNLNYDKGNSKQQIEQQQPKEECAPTFFDDVHD